MVRSRSIRRVLWSVAFVFTCATLITVTSGFAQQGSQIGAVLCSTETPDLQVTEPVSDSVTDLPTVQIEGMALYTSQIDVMVNGQYSHSVAIGFDSILQTQVSLQEGTNTINLQAYFSCNGTNSELDIIIDYQPAVSPTNPGSVVTQVVSSDTTTANLNNNLSSGTVTSQIIDTIKEKLGLEDETDDFDEAIDKSYVNTAFNWVLFLTILTLLGLLFAPTAVIRKLVIIFSLNKRLSVRHPHKLMRFIIAFLIILLAMTFSFT